MEKDFLEMNGFEVSVSADGEDGLKQALSEKFDLILLDLMLPKMDGYEICKKIRNRIDAPILIISSKTDEADKLRGLGLGANDYISKPFSPAELIARVKANLMQVERLTKNFSENLSEIKSGNITINLIGHRVYVKKQEIELKHKEYDLLLFLMSNANKVFTKEQLYARIWGMDAFGDLKTVAVHINRLREKIEDDPQNPVYLETVWGVGYRFKGV